jgi:hypothetical protein
MDAFRATITVPPSIVHHQESPELSRRPRWIDSSGVSAVQRTAVRFQTGAAMSGSSLRDCRY